MKILLVTDGSEFSEYAIDTALAMGICKNSEIRILSVVNFPLPVGIDPIGGMTNYPEIESAQKEQAQIVIEAAAAKLKAAHTDMKVSVEVTTGAPESRIIEVAEEWQAELIIVGSHGYNAWERLLLGSVSSAVVHHAPCSVLVARKPKNKT